MLCSMSNERSWHPLSKYDNSKGFCRHDRKLWGKTHIPPRRYETKSRIGYTHYVQSKRMAKKWSNNFISGRATVHRCMECVRKKGKGIADLGMCKRWCECMRVKELYQKILRHPSVKGGDGQLCQQALNRNPLLARQLHKAEKRWKRSA